MSKKEMTLALEALKYLATQIKPDYEHSKAIKALEEALKQEQGEPVAYLNPDDVCADTAFRWCKIDEFTQPVYTKPQPSQKPWVGLTDEDIEEAYKQAEKKEPYMGAVTRKGIAEAFEQILKEKNT